MGTYKKLNRIPKESIIACSIPIEKHPIINENQQIKEAYFGLLRKVISELKFSSPYVRAVLSFYKEKFQVTASKKNKNNFSILKSNSINKYIYIDILVCIGYRFKWISTQRYDKLKKLVPIHGKTEKLIKNLYSGYNNINDILLISPFCNSMEWIKEIEINIDFLKKAPFRILVTATMSAGKSTFINSLVGKKIANTNNLACTGRLHYIYNKPFDDRLISKWDSSVQIDASNCILNENEELLEDISYESTCYIGRLRGSNCLIIDTPGVNSAEYKNHGDFTQNAIIKKWYDVVIFLINYEQIGTDDERNYLLFLKENISENVSILFVVNKVDSKKKDDFSLLEKMKEVKKYLCEQGFINPIVFFLSSRAAYLNRVKPILIDDDDIDYLESIEKKFKRSTNLIELYSTIKPDYIDKSEDEFDYRCGIAYIENYLLKLMSQ